MKLSVNILYSILFYFLFIPQFRSIRICGNYCGPGWCNGLPLDEALCDTSVDPDPSVFHADRCCKSHDHCCGPGNRSTCNTLLANCIVSSAGDHRDTIETDASWYDWVLQNFADSFICGYGNTSKNTIAYFFESMDVVEFLVSHGTHGMCCGTVCQNPPRV